MTDTTVIGILNFYDNSSEVTIKELAHELTLNQCHYTVDSYCDWRYNTNLRRFIFDPYTGEKINWKEVKKLLLKKIKEENDKRNDNERNNSG